MTARDIRIAAAWLRQQAQAQGAREAQAARDRLAMRQRVAGQRRDAQGRWTNGECARVRGRAGRQDNQFSTDQGAIGQGPWSAPL